MVDVPLNGGHIVKNCPNRQERKVSFRGPSSASFPDGVELRMMEQTESPRVSINDSDEVSYSVPRLLTVKHPVPRDSGQSSSDSQTTMPEGPSTSGFTAPPPALPRPENAQPTVKRGGSNASNSKARPTTMPVPANRPAHHPYHRNSQNYVPPRDERDTAEESIYN